MVSLQTWLTEAVNKYMQVAGLDDIPVDLEKVAKCCGVERIVIQPLANDALVSMSPNDSTITIFLDPRKPRLRRRFSLAHEIGHIFVNLYATQFAAVPGCNVQARGLADTHLEKLCDGIAAEVLMPLHHFKRRCGELGWGLGSVSELSDVFQASTQAVALRLAKLFPAECVLSYWRPTKSNGLARSTQWLVKGGQRRGRLEVMRQLASFHTPPVFTKAFAQGAVVFDGGQSPPNPITGLRGWYQVEARRFGNQEHAFVLALSHTSASRASTLSDTG